MSTWLESARSFYDAFSALLQPSPAAQDLGEDLIIDVLPHDTRILGLCARYYGFMDLETKPKDQVLKVFLKENESIAGIPLIKAFNIFEEPKPAAALANLGIKDEMTEVLCAIFAVVLGDQILFNKVLNKLKSGKISLENLRTDAGFSLIHICLAFDRTQEMLGKLLELPSAKEMINDAKNKQTFTPLALAAICDNLSSFHLLLSAGASLTTKDAMGNTPLLLSFVPSEAEILAAAANIPIQGQSLLTVAASFLTSAGDSTTLSSIVDVPNNTGLTSLVLAASRKDIASAQKLVELGANASAPKISPNSSHEQWNSLMFACETGRTDLVEFLISQGCDVNMASSKFQVTPLQVASFYGRAHVVDILLQYGANPNLLTTEKGSALLYSCLNGKIACVKALIARMIQGNMHDSGDTGISNEIKFILFSSLFTAIRKESMKCSQLLLLKISNLGLDCSNILSFAVEVGCKDKNLLQLLLSMSGKVEDVQVKGQNILVATAETRNTELFSLLTAKYNFPPVIKEHPQVRAFITHLTTSANGSTSHVSNMVTNCVVCFDKEANTKFMPCGHIQCCRLCAQKAIRADPRCPMCRVDVEKVENLA